MILERFADDEEKKEKEGEGLRGSKGGGVFIGKKNNIVKGQFEIAGETEHSECHGGVEGQVLADSICC